MSRSERTAIAVGVGVAGGFAAALATGAGDRLNGLSWFGSGANIIQWASGIAFGASVVTLVTMHVVRSCAAKRWCLRRGEHEVAGTLQKVCHRHHTREHHEKVHDGHAGAHARSGRLGFGESHGRTTVRARPTHTPQVFEDDR